jgi:hypothetical protein
MKVLRGHHQEISALITSGDVSLKERRDAFKRKTGRDTTLDDDHLIAAVAATDDDDDDLFVTNVGHIEKHGYTLIDADEVA